MIDFRKILLGIMAMGLFSLLRAQEADSIRATEVLLPRAEALFELDEYEQADSLLSEAISLLPRWSESYALRGLVRLRLEQYEEATKDLSEAVRLNEGDYASWANRSLAWWYQGATLACESDARKAIRLAPEYGPGHYSLGLAFFSTRRYQDAEQKFSRSLELDSENALAWYNRGICRMYLRQYEGGCQDWDEAESRGAIISPKLRQDYCRSAPTGAEN